MSLEVDADEAFNYSESKSFKFSRHDYLNMIAEEMKQINEKRRKILEEFK